MDTAQAGDSLADWLTAATFADQDADQVTELLAEAVTQWGRAQGWRVYRKARSVMRLPPPYDDRHSWVDVACAQPDGPPIVVEVDRSDRKRSVEKLLAEAEAGRIALWVRWGRGPFTEPPAPIRMVTCPVTARQAVDGRRLFSWLPVDRPAPQHSELGGGGDQTVLFED